MSAVALRHAPVPDCLPPLETGPTRGARGSADHPAAPVQGVLALVVADGAPVEDDEDDFGPVPTRSADLPDPLVWSRGLAQVIVEVLAGLRPASQLLRWTTTLVHEQIRRLAVPPSPDRRRTTRRPVVRSVRVCEPADGIAEVSAVVCGQHRTEALALRLEGGDGRWRVTVLQAC
ncbi:MAG: Rv3235 family protein [Angustibacter sp.]